MKGFGKSLLICIAFLTWSGIGFAATQVVNCPGVSSPTELSANIVCAQFNVSGATLQSVQIAVTGTITGTIMLANNARTPETGSGTVNSQFNLGALPGMTISNPVFTASYGTGNQTLAAGQTATFAGLSGSGSSSLTTSSNLAAYTGAGTFNIPVTTLTGFTALMDGANFEASQTTNASATAVVTYTYLFLPPAISKAFGAGTIPLASSTSLGFTITNPNPGAVLTGVGFNDTLPAGLVVATPNGLTGACGGGVITATSGSGAISLAGATLAAGGSCTFSVNVTGTTDGPQNNTTDPVTSTEGGTGNTATASLNVVVVNVPTVAGWGVIMFVVALGIGSIYYLRRLAV